MSGFRIGQRILASKVYSRLQGFSSNQHIKIQFIWFFWAWKIKTDQSYKFEAKTKVAHIRKQVLALSQPRICRPPPPHKWSDFYERCGMCWIEWETKWIFFWEFYFSSSGWKFFENKCDFEYENDHYSKKKNRKINFSFVSAHSTSFI